MNRPLNPRPEVAPEAPFFNIPNALCLFRITGSFILMGVAFTHMPHLFVGLYLAFAASDLIDGFLARQLGQRSDLGAGLDSIADVLLSLSLIGGAAVMSRELWEGEILLIGLALFSYLVTAFFGFLKFRRLPTFHTWAAKLTHFLVAVAGVSLILQWSVWPLRIAAVATILTNLESLLIGYLLKDWKADVPSVFRLPR